MQLRIVLEIYQMLKLCSTGAPRPAQMAPGQPNGAPAVMGYPRQPAPQLPPQQALGPLVQHGQIPPRREATNEYAALFVALIGKPWPLRRSCMASA